MKLSQATAKERDLPGGVQFGEEALQVTYRPLTYTVREMDAMKDSQDTNRIIETVKRLIVRWDLTDNDETPIPIDHPMVEDEDGKLVPADDDPLRDIPTHIFSEILRAVNEDQQPDPEASRRSRGR
jgi:hypothetical protein